MRRRTNGLGDRAAKGYRTAYTTARDYPGTIAAIVVGAGLTAFLLWAARRAGGWSNLQADAIERARVGYDHAREGYGRAREAIAEGASRLRSQRADLEQ